MGWNFRLVGFCLDFHFLAVYGIFMDLIEASKRAGIRGVQIAEALGVAQSTVNRWLHRETPVPSRHVRRLASMLQIEPEQVLPPESVSITMKDS